MDQINNYADNRLIRDCIYCGGRADTRDHVPSKCLLEIPYPTNLPIVGCCDSCNQNFSKDEQYLACLIESILSGSTEPEKIGRSSIAKILKKSPKLRLRIENSKKVVDGEIVFLPEKNRIKNVMLKLARGHAAFELSQLCREMPNYFWCGPLASLPQSNREAFDSVHIQEFLGEVGSRNMQRLFVTQFNRTNEKGELQNEALIINDWIEVQDAGYRYIAIDDMGQIVIRIVVAEYLACEVTWVFSKP